MLKYQTIPVTPFQQNCSLVWDSDTKQAAVIDPGGDLETLLGEVQRLGLKLEQMAHPRAHRPCGRDGGTRGAAATARDRSA